MTNCVFITCNNKYIPKAVIALNYFCKINNEKNYDKAIIVTHSTNDMIELCEKYNIKLINIDLRNDFILLHKRPYGQKYPIECFYHFYAYKVLSDYKYLILLEPDIYTNKKMDINIDDVKYIAGGTDNDSLISDFITISRDYNKITKEFGKHNMKIKRIAGGLKIYNVKNLEKINFYEKIVYYYQKSIKIGAFRCGDDSLTTLYQLLNPEHVQVYPKKFQIFTNALATNNNIKRITFYHPEGSNKFWNNMEYKKNTIGYHLKNQMLEYIYNNYSLNFIKKYFFDIYRDISNVKIPFYYWNGEHNFGDCITPYFLNKYCDKKSYSFNFDSTTPKIISCGSIMRLCNENSIVYGAGIRDINQNIQPGNIELVRGPLTRKRLTDIGCYIYPNYGDPGLLLPLYFNPIMKKKYKLGIIPHVVHYKDIVNKYKYKDDVLIINLKTNNVEYVIKQILSCDKIISSSLHGLIVSDAYNIPNKWIKFDNKINGDDTKFYDYFSSVERQDRKYINCFNNKNIFSYDLDKLITKVNISFDIDKLKEKMFFDENGIKNYTKLQFSIITNNKINKKEWYAFKEHWDKIDNILVANQETYLKKSKITKARDLKTKDKIKLLSGHKLKNIIRSSGLYYVVSE
jgi:hypothetical protein